MLIAFWSLFYLSSSVIAARAGDARCSCDTLHACVATFIWCEYVSLWQSSRLCCHVHMILVCECASVTPSIPVLQLIYDVSMWVCVSDALRVLSRIHHVDVLCAFSCDALDTCVATCIWCVTTYIWCMQVCRCVALHVLPRIHHVRALCEMNIGV